jgi:hypothetical protein
MPITDAELGAKCREILLSKSNGQFKLAQFIGFEGEVGVPMAERKRCGESLLEQPAPKGKVNVQDEGAEAPVDRGGNPIVKKKAVLRKKKTR